MNLQLRSKFQLRNPAKVLFQNRSFHFQLLLVGGVLVMAAAAAHEIRTARLGSVRGGFEDLIQPRSREARFLFDKGYIAYLARKNEGHEHRLTAPMLVSGKAGQAVSAIDQLLDFQFQEFILCQRGDTDPGVLLS